MQTKNNLDIDISIQGWLKFIFTKKSLPEDAKLEEIPYGN